MIKLISSQNREVKIIETEYARESKFAGLINHHQGMKIRGAINVYCSGANLGFLTIINLSKNEHNGRVVKYDGTVKPGQCDMGPVETGARKAVTIFDRNENRAGYVAWYDNMICTSDYCHKFDQKFISFVDSIIERYTHEFFGVSVKEFLGVNRDKNFIEPKFLFGGDPEFELADKTGLVYNAEFYIKANSNSSIGCDGRSDTGEFRPNYGTPKQLAQSIGSLYKKLALVGNGKLPMMAGDVLPVGGHLHISSPSGHANMENHRNIATILDNYLGKYVVPLNGKARKNTSYGRLGDFRSQPHGGVEYRTPPAYMWRDPSILLVILEGIDALLKKAAKTGVSLPRNKDSWEKSCLRYMGKVKGRLYIEALRQLLIDKEQKKVFASAAWTGAVEKVEEVGTESEILFRDGWQPQTITFFHENLKRLLKDAGAQVRVSLFGLKADRGAVTCGFEVRGYDNMSPVDSGLSFGVPFDTRNDGKDMSLMLDGIYTQIMKERLNATVAYRSSVITGSGSFSMARAQDHKGHPIIEDYDENSEEEEESDYDEEAPW